MVMTMALAESYIANGGVAYQSGPMVFATILSGGCSHCKVECKRVWWRCLAQVCHLHSLWYVKVRKMLSAYKSEGEMREEEGPT